MGFQFHNGTINTVSVHIFFFDSVMFQFHNGTINTRIFWILIYVFVSFQFHNGTINTSSLKIKKCESGVSIPQRYN